VSPPRYLKGPAKPAVPRATPLRDTLQRDAGLRSLTLSARAGQERLATVKLAVPKALHAALAAGGVDEEGWTLLVLHAAAGAKLRQLKPQLELLLQERFGPGTLRIKLTTR
jgi:hypothetical protein